MMWLFAILIVLAMGGIAALAAGRGTPLAEEYGDRPDLGLPASGPLVADDLRRVRFSLALRGYRMSEVDALLDRLATQIAAQADPQADPRTGPRTGPRTDPPPAAEPDGERSTNPEGRGDQPTA